MCQAYCQALQIHHFTLRSRHSHCTLLTNRENEGWGGQGSCAVRVPTLRSAGAQIKLRPSDWLIWRSGVFLEVLLAAAQGGWHFPFLMNFKKSGKCCGLSFIPGIPITQTRTYFQGSSKSRCWRSKEWAQAHQRHDGPLTSSSEEGQSPPQTEQWPLVSWWKSIMLIK